MNHEELMALIVAGGEIMQPPNYFEGVSDDDEDMVMEYVVREGERRERNVIPRIEGYAEEVVPRFSDNEFQNHFRVLPATFQFILGEIGETLKKSTHSGNPMIAADKQLLMALWRLATPDCYRSITQRFGVGHGTGVRAVQRVIRAVAQLCPLFIVWPQGEKADEVIRGFFNKSAFPGTIGAIDGTHIQIRAPNKNHEAYINRKGYHSMHLQAVCDHRGIFTHCFVGHVGSVHDARVFRLSRVFDYLGDDLKFPNDSHIIGDSAYALHTNLLTPFADNGHLTRRQKNFNFCHSSARMVIERTFGLLKGRWRSLLNELDMRNVSLIPFHVMAACVLHNVCELRQDAIQNMVVAARVMEGQPFGRGMEENRAMAREKRNNISEALVLRDV